MFSVLRGEIACLLLLAVFAGFEHVSNAMLVNEQIRLATAIYLDAVAIVPIDPAMYFFAVFEQDDHRRSDLHLLLEVEGFGVCLFLGVSALRHALLGAGESSIAIGIPPLRNRERRTNQLPANEIILYLLRKIFRRAAHRCGVGNILHWPLWSLKHTRFCMRHPAPACADMSNSHIAEITGITVREAFELG